MEEKDKNMRKVIKKNGKNIKKNKQTLIDTYMTLYLTGP